MAETPGTLYASLPPRPLPATYWVVPGRFLVGEHPGSQSRAEAMERLRRCLTAGITCFVDLTEPGELPSYEALLPATTSQGRSIRYLREPIRDHGVPAGTESVARVIAMIDDALGAGHVVYLHCRAGIGRSATVAGCWLANRGAATVDPLEQLQQLWQQSARSHAWPIVPETQEQEDFVRAWSRRGPSSSPGVAAVPALLSAADRIRGALLGLALGDAMGEATRTGEKGAGAWSQHTGLALCLAESLLETGVCDARDQMERYLRWQRDGHLSALGLPGQATPDVARALATYQWRGQPMAGSHDPKDRTTSVLPRVVSVAAYGMADPVAAVSLAVECARTTHQSPVVLDACRYYAALLVGALRGTAPHDLLGRLYEPVPGMWSARPLRPEIVAAVTTRGTALESQVRAAAPDVVHAIGTVCSAIATAKDVPQAIHSAIGMGCEPSLEGALAGALAGALRGTAALPSAAVSNLARLDLLEQFAARLARHHPAAGQPGARAQS